MAGIRLILMDFIGIFVILANLNKIDICQSGIKGELLIF